MLDVSHLPFVHARTIGRRDSTLVNGPYATMQNGKIRVWPDNQPDNGLPATKPAELAPPDKPPGLLFNFPNLWQLRIAAGMRIVNVIAPVDDENVVIYVRTLSGDHPQSTRWRLVYPDKQPLQPLRPRGRLQDRQEPKAEEIRSGDRGTFHSRRPPYSALPSVPKTNAAGVRGERSFPPGYGNSRGHLKHRSRACHPAPDPNPSHRVLRSTSAS